MYVHSIRTESVTLHVAVTLARQTATGCAKTNQIYSSKGTLPISCFVKKDTYREAEDCNIFSAKRSEGGAQIVAGGNPKQGAEPLTTSL